MRWPARFASLFRSLFRRKEAEANLDIELRDHLEQEVQNNLRAGMSDEEARAAAQRLVGPLALYKEECRDARGIGFIENVARDLRYAFRTLRHTPLFTSVAAITLALGIGANATVFTFIENILLATVQAADPHQLVAPNWGTTLDVSYPNYQDFRDRNIVFSSLTAYRFVAAGMSVEPRDSSRVWGYQATGNYFDTLGIKPALGRFFGPADDQKSGAHPVLVISYRLWRSRFGADPNIIGRTVKINAFPFTIIGVAPESFGGTELIIFGDYWLPLGMQPQIEPGFDFQQYRTSQNLWILGRLKPGVSYSQAETNLDSIARNLARVYPNDVNPKDRFRMSRPGLVGADLRGPVGSFGVVLMGITAIGLLLACANLAGMLLARASDRHREIGIRLALGATRPQLLRQLLTESLLLALSGSAVGLGVTYLFCGFLSSWHPAFALPISAVIRPNATVLLFTALAALLTTILFGLTPALQSVWVDVLPSLRNEPVSARLRRWTARDLLVAAQIALSVTLVISSVLVVRSLQHALSLNLGFQPEGAVGVSFDLSLQRYSAERSRRFDDTLQRSLSQTPGFQSVAIVNSLPLQVGGLDSEFIWPANRPLPPPADRHIGMVYNVSPGYFQTARTRLLVGRDINDRDRSDFPAVAVVNDELAKLLFGNSHAIGSRFHFSGGPDTGVQIVGIVETGKYISLGEDPRPALFLPISQSGTGWTTLVARGPMPPQAATDLLRKAVLDLDPELTVFNAGSLKSQLALPLMPARIAAIVLGVFGALAMVLAATGLFALMSYAVSRRSREIGIRMAFGARPSQILASVLRRTAVLCGAGIVLGTILTLSAGRLLSSILYGVGPRDPAVYFSGILLIGAVALLACWSPAVRAIRIDPAKTLREQ